MRENTRTTLNIALTHLQVQRQEIDTAIAALLAVLGEADMVPVSPTGPARPKPPSKGARNGASPQPLSSANGRPA